MPLEPIMAGYSTVYRHSHCLNPYTPNPIKVGSWVSLKDDKNTPAITYKVLEIDGTIATLQEDTMEPSVFYELAELEPVDLPIKFDYQGGDGLF